MAKKFSESEKKIIQLFENVKEITWNNVEYEIKKAGKPKPQDGKGEPKTDLYISMIDTSGETVEIKISFKQENADFIENKTSEERAREILGDEWQEIIIESTMAIQSEFEDRNLLFIDKYGNTEAGSFVLGWRYELVNSASGKLSGEVTLTEEQLIDVYSGTNLSYCKQNSKVGNEIVKGAGVANYMLVCNVDDCFDCNSVLSRIEKISEYVKQHPKLYFACKASNYRFLADKIEGNRPLAVHVDWFVNNEKLDAKIVYESPLSTKTRNCLEPLKEALKQLKIEKIDDINKNNVSSFVYKRIYRKDDD